jgi:long-chain fatty acid transport protein
MDRARSLVRASGVEGASISLVLLACLGVILVGDVAHAGGFHSLDFGTRRGGMMAVMGRPDDATAIFHNPAGLTLREGTHLYLTGCYSYNELGYRLYDSQGKLKPDHEITPDSWSVLPFMAVATDFGTKKLRGGLAVYASNVDGISTPAGEPTRYHVLDATFASLKMTGALAYEVTDRFSIGAGISAVYVNTQSSLMANLLLMDNPDLRFADSQNVRALDRRMSLDGDGWTWDWSIGLLFRPIPTLGLGFGFVSGSEFTLKGKVGIQRPTGAATEIGQKTKMVIPLTLRAGINWEFVPNVEVGLDVSYWHYQVLQEQLMTFDSPILGQSEKRTPRKYGNAWNVGAGILYRPIPVLDVMVGYQHDTSAIPTSTYTLDNVSRDHNGISLGLRWRALSWLAVGATFQRTWFDLLNVQDSVLNPPGNGKGHGSTTQVAVDFSFSL